MAGKSAIPLILVAGGAALLLSGKKKRSSDGRKELKKPTYIDISSDPVGDDRIKFDEECGSIINKLNFDDHNNWLTNRYYQLLDEGVVDVEHIAVQLLKDQSNHCPWDDVSSWTPFMKSVYNQLLDAVRGWHEHTDGKSLLAT